MESMLNRWQKALQAADDIHSSRLAASRKGDEAAKIIKQSLLTQGKDKASISLENRNKDSRTRSNEQKTGSKQNRLTSHKKIETPNKNVDRRIKKQEKILENSTNAIMQLFQPSNPDKFRPKLRSLLQNLILQIGSQKPEHEKTVLAQSAMLRPTESAMIRPTERAFNDLQQRYFQCQKDRQYLRGKLQMYSKRSQGLQRQVQRYGKIQKLIDQSISRQAQLKQQLSRAQHQRSLLQQTMRQQREIYERQASSIRQLIESLKNHLPTH